MPFITFYSSTYTCRLDVGSITKVGRWLAMVLLDGCSLFLAKDKRYALLEDRRDQRCADYIQEEAANMCIVLLACFVLNV